MKDLKFVDLFAGIGGFHQALGERGLGMECVFASEIDAAARHVYAMNHHMVPEGDIRLWTERGKVNEIGPHDVLAAGFPCQPFSKSGHQRGMAETRGTLFFNICQVLEAHQPRWIILENVRNLAGPRQAGTWETITTSLRNLGYRVPSAPAIFSPHLLHRNDGGSPQFRERVFILGERVGVDEAWAAMDEPPLELVDPTDDPPEWKVLHDLPLEQLSTRRREQFKLQPHEIKWISKWDELIKALDTPKLPSFPLWADAFTSSPAITVDMPAWKQRFLRLNSEFYRQHKRTIDAWLDRKGGLAGFPESRRKLEWQAQGKLSLWSCVLQFRPSGIRVKRRTYLPALVAINQTSIYGPQKRRLTPREAARLQGLPDDFHLHYIDAIAYKQLGNGVHVGVVQRAFEKLVEDSDARSRRELALVG